MNLDINIRQESANDFQEIFQVNHLAFGRDNEAKLVEALRKNQEIFVPELSIIANFQNQIIGHILFTKIRIIDDLGNSYQSLALAPMAVKPEFQNKGIGRMLIQKGLEI